MPPLPALLDRYDHVLLDLDGCVRIGEQATERADAAIAALRAAGKGVAFVTNDPALSPEEVVRQLWRLGVRVSLAEVVTVGGAIQHVLAETARWRSAFVIGGAALHRHVLTAGVKIHNASELATEVDVVVVAAHGGFDYAELRTATQAVLHGAEILAAGRDATFPTPSGPWPGTGAVVAAVEAATGITAVSVGKPEPQLLLAALDRLGPGTAIMVGDRLDSDVAGARSAGLDAAVVLTGVTDRDAAEAARARTGSPIVAVADSLGSLVLGA